MSLCGGTGQGAGGVVEDTDGVGHEPDQEHSTDERDDAEDDAPDGAVLDPVSLGELCDADRDENQSTDHGERTDVERSLAAGVDRHEGPGHHDTNRTDQEDAASHEGSDVDVGRPATDGRLGPSRREVARRGDRGRLTVASVGDAVAGLAVSGLMAEAVVTGLLGHGCYLASHSDTAWWLRVVRSGLLPYRLFRIV